MEQNKDIVNINEDFGLDVARKLLTKKIILVHGCLGCEWKGKKDIEGKLVCPHDLRKKTEVVPQGICPRRARYLAMFSKDPQNIKSYTHWQRDFNNAIAQQEKQRDDFDLDSIRVKIDILTNKLSEATKDDDKKDIRKELNAATKEFNVIRDRWESINDKVMKYTDKKIDRETPKVINMQQSFSPTDIQAIVAGDYDNVVDGEIVEDNNEADP